MVSTREIRFFKKEKSTALTRYPQSCGFIEVFQAELINAVFCFFQNVCQFQDRINFSTFSSESKNKISIKTQLIISVQSLIFQF